MSDAPLQRRPTLAAVAISKNEERDLPGFLEHLLPWVDEVVLVDDASTDRTREIAEAAGPKVRLVSHPMDPETGFGGQRNVAVEHATADWLLHMDVDERVTPELAASIQQAITDPHKNAFRYRRLNFFLHRPMNAGGWQGWNRPQLARRGKHRFINPIHEAVVVEGGEAATGQLDGWMWHLIDEDYVERVQKNVQYMQKSGQQILDRGVRVRWYHMVFHPLLRAFQSYVLKGGWRTGTRGVLFALYTFSGTFNWWAYAWDRQNRIPRETLEEDLRQRWAQTPSLS